MRFFAPLAQLAEQVTLNHGATRENLECDQIRYRILAENSFQIPAERLKQATR